MAESQSVLPHNTSVGVQKSDFGFDAESLVGSPPESLELDINETHPQGTKDFGFDAPMQDDDLLLDEILSEEDGITGMFFLTLCKAQRLMILYSLLILSTCWRHAAAALLTHCQHTSPTHC